MSERLFHHHTVEWLLPPSLLPVLYRKLGFCQGGILIKIEKILMGVCGNIRRETSRYQVIGRLWGRIAYDSTILSIWRWGVFAHNLFQRDIYLSCQISDVF